MCLPLSRGDCPTSVSQLLARELAKKCGRFDCHPTSVAVKTRVVELVLQNLLYQTEKVLSNFFPSTVLASTWLLRLLATAGTTYC